MGLDTIELIMNVEDRFHIQIADIDAERIQTVGQLAAHVAERIGQSNCSTCTSQRVFHRVRAGLVTLGAEPRHVRLSSRMDEFLPAGQTIVGWGQLGAATGLRLPELERPGWVTTSLLLAPLVVMAGSLFWNWHSLGVGVLGGFVVMWLGFLLTRPLAVVVPEDVATVGQLVRKLLNMNWIDGQEMRDAEIFQIVRAIVSEQAGVAEEEIGPDSHFIGDLHMD
jgi:acyl carrier protein